MSTKGKVSKLFSERSTSQVSQSVITCAIGASMFFIVFPVFVRDALHFNVCRP